MILKKDKYNLVIIFTLIILSVIHHPMDSWDDYESVHILNLMKDKEEYYDKKITISGYFFGLSHTETLFPLPYPEQKNYHLSGVAINMETYVLDKNNTVEVCQGDFIEVKATVKKFPLFPDGDTVLLADIVSVRKSNNNKCEFNEKTKGHFIK